MPMQSSPTPTKRSQGIDDQTSAAAADCAQPAKKHIINHIPATSTSQPSGGAGSSQDHASHAEALNRHLHQETQQLQSRLQMTKLEAAEQRQVGRAEVASCEQQLQELGNKSSYRAQERAQQVEQVEMQARQEVTALKRQAALKELQAQEAAMMAAATTTAEVQSSTVHATAICATAQDTLKRQQELEAQLSAALLERHRERGAWQEQLNATDVQQQAASTQK